MLRIMKNDFSVVKPEIKIGRRIERFLNVQNRDREKGKRNRKRERDEGMRAEGYEEGEVEGEEEGNERKGEREER